MQTKVLKWVDCLGVRISRGFAEEIGLGACTKVNLAAMDGELALRPSVPSQLRLEDLLAGIIPNNIHDAR